MRSSLFYHLTYFTGWSSLCLLSPGHMLTVRGSTHNWAAPAPEEEATPGVVYTVLRAPAPARRGACPRHPMCSSVVTRGQHWTLLLSGASQVTNMNGMRTWNWQIWWRCNKVECFLWLMSSGQERAMVIKMFAEWSWIMKQDRPAHKHRCGDK